MNILLLAAVAWGMHDAETAELTALTHRWVALEMEWNDAKVAQDKIADLRLDLGVDRVVMTNHVGSTEWSWGRFLIDVSTTPKRCELSVDHDARFPEKNFHGIYELKDDRLRVCLVPEDVERPTDLTTPANGRMLLRATFVRQSREDAARDQVGAARADVELAKTAAEKQTARVTAAEACWRAGLPKDARTYAEAVLAEPISQALLIRGDARRSAHRVLGHIALDQNSLSEARRHLIDMGKEPAFRPIEMDLAEKLLVRGERQSVLDFLGACRKSAEIDQEELDRWSNEVRTGKIPDFAVRSNPWSDRRRSSLSALEGTWRFVSGQHEDDPAVVETFHVEVDSRGEAGRFRFQRSANVGVIGRFDIGIDESPQAINIAVTEGDMAGLAFHGAYKLANGELVICAASSFDPRPREFITPHGSGRLLLRFERTARSGNRTLDHDDDARRAVKVLERAATDDDRFNGLMEAAKLCMNAGRTADADKYANDLLMLATTRLRNHPQVDEALHDAHLVLGRVALRRNQLEVANRHLLAVAPHANRRGIGLVEYPDMTLAKELLQVGEMKTVVDFIAMLRQRADLISIRPLLDDWTKDVKEGRAPDFQFHVVVDFENL